MKNPEPLENPTCLEQPDTEKLRLAGELQSAQLRLVPTTNNEIDGSTGLLSLVAVV